MDCCHSQPRKIFAGRLGHSTILFIYTVVNSRKFIFAYSRLKSKMAYHVNVGMGFRKILKYFYILIDPILGSV